MSSTISRQRLFVALVFQPSLRDDMVPNFPLGQLSTLRIFGGKDLGALCLRKDLEVGNGAPNQQTPTAVSSYNDLRSEPLRGASGACGQAPLNRSSVMRGMGVRW